MVCSWWWELRGITWGNSAKIGWRDYRPMVWEQEWWRSRYLSCFGNWEDSIVYLDEGRSSFVITPSHPVCSLGGWICLISPTSDRGITIGLFPRGTPSYVRFLRLAKVSSYISHHSSFFSYFCLFTCGQFKYASNDILNWGQVISSRANSSERLKNEKGRSIWEPVRSLLSVKGYRFGCTSTKWDLSDLERYKQLNHNGCTSYGNTIPSRISREL